MKALIFGSNGQDGYYLSALLKKNKIEVMESSRKSGNFQGDVSNYAFVDELIKSYKPTYVFHLAANSSTRHETLFDNHLAISTGTLNILEAVRLNSPSTKVFLSGSAMQFQNQGNPISESSPFEASSPYSLARIHSVYAGRYYRKTFGIEVYCGYFFNHDSPLRSERHVNQKIVKAVKRIQSGSNEVLELGNIEVKKEFSYAGDIVEAIWVLVNQNKVFEVVIGSGKAYSIKDWVEYCFNKINKKWEDHVLIKKDFIPEYNILVSDPSLLKSLGWKPEVDFQKLANIMMEAE